MCGLTINVNLAEKIWKQKDVGSALFGPWGFGNKVKNCKIERYLKGGNFESFGL